MSKPAQSNPANAVLVAIRTPRVTGEELESSLQELTRLVKTLGYNVVGQVTQKRSSDKYAAVLGQGKLAELALWTGGSGKIESAFERPKHKAASKFEGADSDITEEATKQTTRSRPLPALASRRRSSSWTVICRRPN